MVFCGEPMGVNMDVPPPISIAIITPAGSAPMVLAIEMPIGNKSAVAAMLDINWVMQHAASQMIPVIISGVEFIPNNLTTPSAIKSPAPVLLMAVDMGSIPAYRKMVLRLKCA